VEDVGQDAADEADQGGDDSMAERGGDAEEDDDVIVIASPPPIPCPRRVTDDNTLGIGPPEALHSSVYSALLNHACVDYVLNEWLEDPPKTDGGRPRTRRNAGSSKRPT
jgi:hypothetical protein